LHHQLKYSEARRDRNFGAAFSFRSAGGSRRAADWRASLRECLVLFRAWNLSGCDRLSGVPYNNPEIKMRNLIVAACCAALVGSVSVASAQTTGPAAQPTVKASDPVNAQAKTMKKKHKAKKAAKPDAGMTKDTK
jgi:hypothetical protein